MHRCSDDDWRDILDADPEAQAEHLSGDDFALNLDLAEGPSNSVDELGEVR